MANDQTKLGDNAESDLKRRIERRLGILEQADELRAELATFKAEDKDDGFTEKAIADAVRMKRADPEKVLATLLYEAERDVYRKAAGLPVDIETAEKIAREHVKEVPEPKQKRQGMR